MMQATLEPSDTGRILIVGSSGLLGRETAEQLLSQGYSVRVMTRSPSRVEDLKKAGAEVAEGDLIDPGSLARACQGVNRVLAAAHALLGKGRYRSEAVDDAGHRALIDAARAAGVSHFVYTSGRGASPEHPVDFWRTKYRIEAYLKGSGLGYTILRPSAFMECHAHFLNGKSILESGKTRLLGKGSKPRNFIAVTDVAQFAVLALTDTRLKNTTLELGGPDTVSDNEVAALYGKYAGVTPKVSHLHPAGCRLLSVVLKPFHPGISRILYMASLPDEAWDERFDPSSLRTEFPITLTSLDEFVRARAEERLP